MSAGSEPGRLDLSPQGKIIPDGDIFPHAPIHNP
jgi:hypothetical protein